MRKFNLFIAAVAVACFWASSALATSLIYEPFDYTSGVDILGLRNTSAGTTAGTAVQADTSVGNIWKQASTATLANSIDIASGSLTGPSELKSSIGNSVSIVDGTNSGAANRLAFRADTGTGSNITSGTIYYSFLLRVDSLLGSNNTTGDYFISLNNTGNAATTANPTVFPGNMRSRVDPNDGTKFSLGMFTQRTPTSTDAGWVNGLTPSQTVFVVGSYNVAASNSTKLWINPDPLSFGLVSAPAFTAQDTTSGAGGTSIGSLLLHQRNLALDATLDELRVGTTWAEVTPLGTPTLYWDVNGSTAGAGGASPNGTWDSSTTNWNNAAAGDGDALAWASGGAATFSAGSDATGTYTIAVSGTQSASQITFEDGSPTLTGGQVNLTGSLHTILTSSGVTATIGSVVGGSVGFIKDGSGTLVLTASEVYSGDTAINAGTLQVGSGGTTGSLPTGSAITTTGTLVFNRGNSVTQGTDFSGAAIAGTGGLTQGGGGTLTLNAANTFSGTTRALAGTLHLSNSLALQNSTLDLNGVDTGAVVFDSSLSASTVGALNGSRNLALANAAASALALTVGNANGSYSGALSGTGSLAKAGTGTQTLSGANTYAGGTTINAGTLQFTQTVSMPAGGSPGGDYNGDGKTDGADYVTWRNDPIAFGGNPGYAVWRANFGATGGGVTVNNGGTLGVNAGGVGEWTNSTVVTDPASIAGLIAGTGGQGSPNQVTWNAGSTLAVDTTNAPGAALTYSGVIGSFRTSGGGTTNAVGFTKRGTATTLSLSGNNTFSGPLSIAANGGTLLLTGTNLNAGTTSAIPTVGIGTNATLQLGVSDSLPSGSLINTQGPAAQMFLQPTFTQTVRSLSGNNGVVTVQSGAILTIADQVGDNYVFGNGAGTANLRSEDTSKVIKSGAGTFTLFGDNGNNFGGEFVMQNGRLNLSRNQALGTPASGRLTITGGQLGRTNTTANFTYSPANLDLHVLRYDLSDAPTFTSQFGASTVTTLKQNTVEINITNSGAPTASSGRFTFLGDIRNHDPSPFGGDDPNAIRGIRKTGNGVLSLGGTGGSGAGTVNGGTSYKGATTIEDGVLLMLATSTLGDYTGPTYGTLNLKGGILATNATRTTPVKNPVVVDGAATLSHLSTTNGVTSVIMDFDNDSFVGTSGSLTITNMNTGTGNTVFKPLFLGKNFNFGLPITISSSTGTAGNIKSNELQFGNASDTQTFSGVISGGGSVRRVNAGGTTVLSGLNTYTGSTSIDAGTLSIANPFLADAADVLLTTGGIFNLGFAGADTINRLFFDGVPQAVGTYGATGSGATFINDTFFTGTGRLNVTSASGSGSGFESGAVPEPASAAMAIFGMTLLVAGKRRRRSVGC